MCYTLNIIFINKGAAGSTTTGTTTTTSTSAAASSTATTGLNVAAKAAGKLYFGSATDNPELTDAPYVAILSDSTQFGALTPGNSMKWVRFYLATSLKLL